MRCFKALQGILILGLLFLLPGCLPAQKEKPKEETKQLQVVASIFPLEDIVRKIGGDRANVTTLLPPGASAHTYEPTTADLKKTAGADLLVLVGGGVDLFAAKIVKAEPPAKVLTLTEGIELLAAPQIYLEEENGDNGHREGEMETHVWLDPVLVRDELAPKIAEALSFADKAGALVYQQNLKDFQRQLTSLDNEIRNTKAGFSRDNFLVFHAAWHYFASRYGLRDINIEEFPNKEPTARQLISIIDLARQTKAGVIFVEPQFSSKAAEVIADEYGGKVLVLDPLGGAGIDGRDSYLELMRWNLSQLEKGLK